MEKVIYKYGKKFFYDSSGDYNKFKNRLTLLRRVHPRLKYVFVISKINNKTIFRLYVRKWGGN